MTPEWLKDSPSFSNARSVSQNFDDVRNMNFLMSMMAAHQTGIPVMPGYNTQIAYNSDKTIDDIQLTHESDGSVFGYFFYYGNGVLTVMDVWYKPIPGAWLKVQKGRFIITYNADGNVDTITSGDIP